MKLLIKIQCFCTFLGITLFLLFFKIQTEALLECTLSRYTLHYTHPGINDPQNLYIETHHGTSLLPFFPKKKILMVRFGAYFH